VQLCDFASVQTGKGLDDPPLVGARHVFEGLAPLSCEAHAPGAPVACHVDAFHEALGDELVGDAGDIAPGHHHAARQLVHAQPVGRAFQLGHQVEARQRGDELLAQGGAHLLFHQLGTGQQAQPQAQFFRVLAVGAGFEVHWNGFHLAMCLVANNDLFTPGSGDSCLEFRGTAGRDRFHRGAAR
jgi:hypothetical protein